MKIHFVHIWFTLLIFKQTFAIETADTIDEQILLPQEVIEKWQETVGPVSKEILQWLYWESQANVFLKTFKPVKIPFIERSQLTDYNISLSASHDHDPEIAKRFLITNTNFTWPFHPTNTLEYVCYQNVFNERQETVVPFFLEKERATKFFWGAYTASRSTVLFIDGLPLLSVKLSTNYPTFFREAPCKADLRQCVKFSVIKSQLISVMDEHWGERDPQLIILKDPVVMKEKTSQNGFTIRDLAYFENGNYFLPAFSIPFIGGDIAKKFDEPFTRFWAKHYAKAVGKAKAKLLLRYGLQMPSPSPQNILLELDHSLMPTGVVIFRDISDFYYVPFVGIPLGTSKFAEKMAAMGAIFSKSLYPGFSTSIMNMQLNSTAERQEPGNSFTINKDYWWVYGQWLKAHNLAYWKHIRNSLNLEELPNIEEIYDYRFSTRDQESCKESIRYNEAHSDYLQVITDLLKGEQGQEAIKMLSTSFNHGEDKNE